jgi:hypothetical protein
MMHMTKGWSGLRTAVIALSLFAWTTTGVKAAPVPNLLDYSTAGLVLGPTGIAGTNVISFVPVGTTNNPYAEVDPSSNVSLGSFQVAPLPDGQTTSYTNTPFQISFIPNSYAGTKLTDATPVMVTGTLTGQVTGDYQSSVTVSFNPVANGTFDMGGVPSTLNVLQNDQKLLVPASDGGTTTLEASIISSGGPNNEAAAPEPSTIALFLSTIGGLGLRRYVLSRRRPTKV